MPVLIGELEKITGSPSSVTQVMVRAHQTRITGAALTTDELVPIPVDRQGRFEVPLRPGKAVLVLVHGGRVGEGERFPMLVEEGLGTIVSAIKLASDRFDDYELDELERTAADMLAHIDKAAVSATQATVSKEAAEKERAAAEKARQGAETIEQGIPDKVNQEIATQLPGELDERVPPLVAESIADDRAVADAAAAAVEGAVNDAVDAGLPGKADTSYVDAQDQALGERIDDAHWYRGGLGSSSNLDDYRGLAYQGLYRVTTSVGGGTGLSGWVEVTYDSNSARTRQIFSPSSPNESMSLERKYSGGSWSAWKPAHWRGAPITSGTIDTVTTPGQFAVTSSNVAGIPILSPGSLEVLEGGSGASSLMQRYLTSSSTPSLWVRPRSGEGWGAWVHVGGHARHISSTGDLDNERSPGILNVTSSLVKNLPIAVVGSVEILPASGGVLQRFTSGEDEPQTFVRHLSAGGTWSEWVQSAGQDDEAGVRPHPVTYTPTETVKSSGYIPYAVSADGATSWNYNSSELRQSNDGGHTWQVARTFGGQSTEFVEELANGELIVATTGTVDGVRHMRRVWVSTGYDRANPSAASWEVKITGSAPMVKFVDWCFHQHDNILLMNEYGPKSGYTWAGGSSIIEEGQNARYTWMSEDYGQTWARIFDLNEWLLDNGRPNADGQHLHGVAWDKHWDRIWITFGDNLGGTATNGIIYSDDKGATWEAAHWTGTAESVGQVVGIQPMKDCIVFAGDMTPSGYLRIDREGGKTRTEWEVTTAWTFSDSDLHLCHSIIHREFQQGGEITLMGFSQEGTNSPSYIIATRDGYHTDLIWVDEQNRSLGLRTMAGPTSKGELIAAISTGAGTVELRGVLDIFGTDWSTVHALQDSVDDLSEDVATRAPLVHEHTASQITDLHHYQGTGFPEGKVTAPVGSIYVDTAATNGAVRWIKTSGAGNAGWVVEFGDTGWRDITSQWGENTPGTNPISLGDGGKFFIRRKDGDVMFRILGPATATRTFGSIIQLLTGWRPEIDTEVTLARGMGIRHTRYWISLEGATEGNEISSSGKSVLAQWPTQESWPSTLPGTPS